MCFEYVVATIEKALIEHDVLREMQDIGDSIAYLLNDDNVYNTENGKEYLLITETTRKRVFCLQNDFTAALVREKIYFHAIFSGIKPRLYLYPQTKRTMPYFFCISPATDTVIEPNFDFYPKNQFEHIIRRYVVLPNFGALFTAQ